MTAAVRLAVLLFVCALRVVPAHAAATAEQVQAGARLLDLLRGVQGEYAEAFDDHGALVRPIELEEAGLLLAEARDLAPKLGIDAAVVQQIEKAVADHASQDALAQLIGTLTARVTALTGVAPQPLPPQAPSVERGAALFHDNCATCHGADGAGDGDESKRLGLKPANFTDVAFMRAETPDDFFNVITLGRRRSGMPAWSDALSVQERWDLVRFVFSLTKPAALVQQGNGVLASCPECAATLPGPVDAAARSDDDLLGALEGVGGAAKLDASARTAVVAALRSRAFDGLVGDGAAATPARAQKPAREAFAEVHGLLDAVAAGVERGEGDTTALATDAYMRFEPYEKRLGAIEPAMVRRLEEGFVRLRHAVREPAEKGDVPALVAALHHDLEQAVVALEPATGAWVRFVQSAGIILREGFEVVLVVGALIAYVRRSGQPAMVRALYAGSLAGVVASVATAVVLVTALRVTPWAGEALEGAAMLLAAVVLFWVSYWLISKSEADRWQRYIRGKVQTALSGGSRRTLAIAAFLAVYREGFETILFYQALFASVPAGDVMVPAGLVAGLVLLAIVYWGLERIGLKIPMHAFFVGTGAFLYAMAVVFAGRGVAELQEAALLPLTPVAWAPRIETLGVFPTRETLLAQGVFVLLLLYAIGVTLVRRRSRGGDVADATPSDSRKVARG
jgi:high-affinity iron transporter